MDTFGMRGPDDGAQHCDIGQWQGKMSSNGEKESLKNLKIAILINNLPNNALKRGYF